MYKKYEKFSIGLETLLRNDNSIVPNRDELLFNMFGCTQYENKAKKILNDFEYYDYFFIGKILFFENDIDKIIKNKKDLIMLLKSDNYMILNNEEHIDILKNRLNKNISGKEFEENEFDFNLEIIPKKKIDNNFFKFSNTNQNSYFLSEIITPEFKMYYSELKKSSPSQLSSKKVHFSTFINEVNEILSAKDFEEILGIKKDIKSNFTRTYKLLHDKYPEKELNKLSWIKIKKLTSKKGDK